MHWNFHSLDVQSINYLFVKHKQPGARFSKNLRTNLGKKIFWKSGPRTMTPVNTPVPEDSKAKLSLHWQEPTKHIWLHMKITPVKSEKIRYKKVYLECNLGAYIIESGNWRFWSFRLKAPAEDAETTWFCNELQRFITRLEK